MSTITLSSIPELTAAVGVPRLAAIEAPLGYLLGRPGDQEGQTAVLLATLRALAGMTGPGSVSQLPFEWPDSARRPSCNIAEACLKPDFRFPSLSERRMCMSLSPSAH